MMEENPPKQKNTEKTINLVQMCNKHLTIY